MNDKLSLELPVLEEFEIDKVPYKVVDPSKLPKRTLKMFDEYMKGSAAPHPVYVYRHDYTRFCMLVRQGRLITKSDITKE